MVLELQRADRVRDASRSSRTGRARSRTSDRCTTCRRCDDASACRMRYITGSRMLRLGEAMSILARRVREPSGNSPARMRRNRSRFSSTRAIAIGAVLAGLGERAAILAHLVGRQVADIGLARLDQLHGPVVKLLEVIGSVVQRRPSRSRASGTSSLIESTYSTSSLVGIGVVEAQVALAAVLAREAEVEADRLGMADVQIAVGLGREARLDAARRTARCGCLPRRSPR